MLEVIIIGDKDGDRIKPLLKTFENDQRFTIKIWSPVYLDSFSDKQLTESGFNVDRSTVFMMRKLSLPEIGCAIAHNSARKFLASKEFGGVILEDDARIPNLDYFFVSSLFFLKTVNVPAVLNFTSLRKFEDFVSKSVNTPSLRKKMIHSPLSVGYVLNKSGAEILSSTIYCLCSMPDWPYSKIHKYILCEPAVVHGDAGTLSTIDPNNKLDRNLQSSRKRWANRIRLFSFYYYLQNSKSFRSFKEYLIVMLLPRLLFTINRIFYRS